MTYFGTSFSKFHLIVTRPDEFGTLVHHVHIVHNIHVRTHHGRNILISSQPRKARRSGFQNSGSKQILVNIIHYI